MKIIGWIKKKTIITNNSSGFLAVIYLNAFEVE